MRTTEKGEKRAAEEAARAPVEKVLRRKKEDPWHSFEELRQSLISNVCVCASGFVATVKKKKNQS